MAWNLVGTAVERSAADLYEACARDDDSAIDEFVRRYQPELAGYARRHGAEDPEGMADLATFDTVRRLADMRSMEEPAVRAYLYRAIKGRLIDERQVSVPQVSIDGLGVELTTDGPESPVLDQLEFSEMLELLTPAEREVVSHRFVGGYTSVETAARVGRSPDAVRRLQSNAIARLRLALAVAAFLVAAGAGYWLASSNQTVRTTEPIGSPTEQQLPDSPRRSSGRSPTTPGPQIAPTPTGGIVSANQTATAEASSNTPRPSTTGSTTEPSTTISAPEPSEQGSANSAGPDGGQPTPGPPLTQGATTTPTTSTGSTLVLTTPPATSPTTTTTPPTTGPTTSATPTSTTPATTPSTPPTTTGVSTTSGDTVETTRPSNNRGRGNRGRGRGGRNNRGRGNGGPDGERHDGDRPGRGGGPGRGRGPHGPT